MYQLFFSNCLLYNQEALAVMKGDDSDRLYDIWCDGPMPRLPEDFVRINGKETKGVAIQGCLEDDPGFRPFLVDMRLPEPEKAISDAANQVRLSEVKSILQQAQEYDLFAKS